MMVYANSEGVVTIDSLIIMACFTSVNVSSMAVLQSSVPSEHDANNTRVVALISKDTNICAAQVQAALINASAE